MTGIHAPHLPEAAIRARAREGTAAVFPGFDGYGRTLFGAGPAGDGDELDRMRIVPPVFVPGRLEKLFDLGREPMYGDVDLTSSVGGFTAPLPVFVCAFGSTRVAGGDLGVAASTQAGRLGLPMVIGENVVPMRGYGRSAGDASDGRMLLDRIRAYTEAAGGGHGTHGGVVVQQSTEDADAEVWNLVYSDPYATGLLDTGRLAFELKVGQGAKPGLGGMTMMTPEAAAAVRRRYVVDDAFGAGTVLRSSSPGTFTAEILRHQVRLMRNNYPRARVWVKLHPGRDVAAAAEVAWRAGADAVTVDGAEGGTGWAPTVFLDQVGLPLAECLRRLAGPRDGALPSALPSARPGGLNVSGRIWEGGRALKCLALGASAVGLGRAALLAVDEDPADGLVRLVRCLELELRLLISALGKYDVSQLDREDLWLPEPPLGTERRTGNDDHSDQRPDYRAAEPGADLRRDRVDR
ncbi:glutamate synthase-related protein [Dactylosporangium sp. NPDC048998]|uniref:glutamate synthase-related protein n=1 Tax=Dactylosporangium sp. NPDC048998 TaxID=3363976 RepID=UPI00371FB588